MSLPADLVKAKSNLRLAFFLEMLVLYFVQRLQIKMSTDLTG